MKSCLLFVFAAFISINLYSQRSSWYFPEYKFTFRPDSTCSQQAVSSIQSWQYLKVRVYDRCRYVEVSCYNSKDSTLKEKGLYYNSSKIVEYNARGSHAGTDSAWTARKQHIIFRRVGTWKFYNRGGGIIKTIKYKNWKIAI